MENQYSNAVQILDSLREVELLMGELHRLLGEASAENQAIWEELCRGGDDRESRAATSAELKDVLALSDGLSFGLFALKMVRKSAADYFRACFEVPAVADENGFFGEGTC